MMLSSSSKRNRKGMGKCNGTGERIQVIANILNYCLVYRERTYVIENTGLEPERVNYYLGYLFRRGFIQIGVSSQGVLIYKTRDKGRTLLEMYYNMIQECLEYHKNIVKEIRENYVSVFEQEPNVRKLPALETLGNA
jgi:predicted transcriptional regulator